jgi:hypothetical protein
MEKDPTPLLMMTGILIPAARSVKQNFYRPDAAEIILRRRDRRNGVIQK